MIMIIIKTVLDPGCELSKDTETATPFNELSKKPSYLSTYGRDSLKQPGYPLEPVLLG